MASEAGARMASRVRVLAVAVLAALLAVPAAGQGFSLKRPRGIRRRSEKQNIVKISGGTLEPDGRESIDEAAKATIWAWSRRWPTSLRAMPTRESIAEALTQEEEEALARGEESLTFSGADDTTLPQLWSTVEGRRNALICGTLLSAAMFKVGTIAAFEGNPIRVYEAAANVNPVFVKACTSGVAYGFGDALSQILLYKNFDKVDLWRSARSGSAGFIGHGPLCHYWINWMEAHLSFGGAWYSTFVKVIADQTGWSIYLNAMYATIIGSLALKPPGEIIEDVKDTAWPALRSSWRFWPFVHMISFSPYVPVDLKLLWVDTMEIIWVCILSRVNNEAKKERRDELAEEVKAL